MLCVYVSPCVCVCVCVCVCAFVIERVGVCKMKRPWVKTEVEGGTINKRVFMVILSKHNTSEVRGGRGGGGDWPRSQI